MTLLEYIEKYEGYSTKEKTKYFNELSVKERKVFLEGLSAEAKDAFVTKIRKQAVDDFGTHEREAIENGTCTRDWIPEQIESIMKISQSTGEESINGGKAYDINGKAYYGHHMIDVSTHPEYAGDWRNIQALDHDEHYKGAHAKGTQVPTEGYYDIEKKIRVIWFKDIDRITFFI